MPIRRIVPLAMLPVLGAFLLMGCQPPGKRGGSEASGVPAEISPGRIQFADFSDPLRTAVVNGPTAVRGARNETISFAIQVNSLVPLKGNRPMAIRVNALKQGAAATIAASAFAAWQALPMPIDANRAGFVRHTGLDVASYRLPRALLPIPITDGLIAASSLRNPADPTNPRSRADAPGAPAPLLWFDLAIPPAVAAGRYQTALELLEDGKVVASTGMNLLVDDFVLPDERHLAMVGLLDWESLVRLYPQHFRQVRPQLLSKAEPRYAGGVRLLDDVVRLAQSHRVQVIVPELQPVVKWPTGQPPAIDWGDFDAIVGPWMRGDAFADSVPLNYWPLPSAENLSLHGPADRNAYWLAAASYFDQSGYLSRSGVSIERQTPGRIRIEEMIDVSEEAASLLNLHPGLRVAVPLEEDQVQLATPAALRRIDPATLGRLTYMAPGLVSTPPLQHLPRDSGSARWLRTDLTGMVPYAGAGAHDREVRLWAWLAFIRDASIVRWPSVLPGQSGAAEAAGPDELVWFYPGAWFGVEKPLPSIHLKWLRRAQQDYEYLWLARQRGQGERAMTLARLLAKPVQVQPLQDADPVYAMLSGTSDPRAWADALNHLARTVLISQPGQGVDPAADSALRFAITAWAKSLDRPMLVARDVEWTGAGNTVDVRLAVEVYNTAEQAPVSSRLQWSAFPEGWQPVGPGAEVPPPVPYTVNRFALNARIDLDKIGNPTGRRPVAISYVESETGRPYALSAMLPAAWCERRIGPAPLIDGDLGEWHELDAMHKGPLVQMLSRPAVQRQEMLMSETGAAIYSCWTASHLYLGFRVDGADTPLSNAEKSYVDYQFRRAWGEDVCQVLVQPVYPDKTEGPLFHLAVKPRGQIKVERRLDPKTSARPWQAFEGTGIVYGARGPVPGAPIWRGELQIPWDDLSDPQHSGQRPAMLRFNFSQHRGSTGKSASWAGPVDFGQDESITGVLQVRRPDPLNALPAINR